MTIDGLNPVGMQHTDDCIWRRRIPRLYIYLINELSVRLTISEDTLKVQADQAPHTLRIPSPVSPNRPETC